MSPTPEEVRNALARVVESSGFASAGRLGPFLAFVVERALSGEPIKESIVGVEVFGRPADYDPRLDPIVRVEARRLRSRLSEYYAGAGADDPVGITLPKGAYAPAFANREPEPGEVAGPLPAESETEARTRWLPWALIAVAGVGMLVAASLRFAPSTDEPPSVAVLPFVNLSGEASDDYFSDGLTEEIIDRLTKIRGLQVVARSSSFQFRGEAGDLREVGRRLHASAVVEGSVRRSEDRLRVTAQLVNVEDGYHLWSHTYEREVADVFSIQDDVARAIAGALRVELRVGLEPRPEVPTGSLDAYDLYLKGRYHVMHDALPGLELATDSFERATEADPEYAAAHAALAQAYALLAYYKLRPPEVAWPKAAAAAERALAIDPRLAGAHAVLGLVEAHFKWKWDEAEAILLEALRLNPRSSDVHVAYAWGTLLPQGRLPEVFLHVDRAIELDPESSLAHQLRSFALLIDGRIDEAIESYRRQVELNPSHADNQWDLGMALAVAGRYEEATRQFGLGGKIREGASWEPGATELLLIGEPEKARAIIENWDGFHDQRPLFVSYAYGLLGDADKAAFWLQRAYEERDPQVVWAKVDPRLDSVRDDPRIQAIIRKIGL